MMCPTHRMTCAYAYVVHITYHCLLAPCSAAVLLYQSDIVLEEYENSTKTEVASHRARKVWGLHECELEPEPAGLCHACADLCACVMFVLLTIWST